jgi:hypothetical protein
VKHVTIQPSTLSKTHTAWQVFAEFQLHVYRHFYTLGFFWVFFNRFLCLVSPVKILLCNTAVECDPTFSFLQLIQLLQKRQSDSSDSIRSLNNDNISSIRIKEHPKETEGTGDTRHKNLGHGVRMHNFLNNNRFYADAGGSVIDAGLRKQFVFLDEALLRAGCIGCIHVLINVRNESLCCIKS